MVVVVIGSNGCGRVCVCGDGGGGDDSHPTVHQLVYTSASPQHFGVHLSSKAP